jgi:hypothetical protein
VIASAKKLSGYHEPADGDKPVFTGRIRKESYSIEKYFIKGEGDYVIPFLLFRPVSWGSKAMLYLNPEGKSAQADPGAEIERFVMQGYAVLAPDMLGCGETGPGIFRGDAYFDGRSHNLWYASILAGRSITGIHTGDVVKLLRWMRNECHYAEIKGFARREMAPVLLHAALFDVNISAMVLAEPYSSFSSIVMNRNYNTRFILSTIPEALTRYDLPDLAAAFAPRKLFIAGMTDGNGTSFNLNNDTDVIKSEYLRKNAAERLKIQSDLSGIDEWLK